MMDPMAICASGSALAVERRVELDAAERAERCLQHSERNRHYQAPGADDRALAAVSR